MFIRSLGLFFALLSCSQNPLQSQTAKATDSSAQQDNQELKAIVQRDQAIRPPSGAQGEPATGETDEDRRGLVRAFINHDDLHTGLDYANAALVFQHGSKPEDYLLAHALAVIGASKGNRLALWLSAATLDRYLQSVGKPQIYGTQFKRDPPEPFTMEPSNPTLLTDKLRKETDVPTEAEAMQNLEQLNRQMQRRATRP